MVLAGLVALLLSGGLWVGLGNVCAELGTPPSYPVTPREHGPILVVGDIQPTSFFERVFLRREDSGNAPDKLLRAMADEDPRFVVLLGDLVFDGESCSDWDRADRLFAPLRETGAGFLLAPGNHDWQGRDELCRKQLRGRFEHLRDAPFSETRVGELAFIQLESNQEVIENRWEEQAHFIEERLEALDEDDSVRGVFVLTHHPPFTNSTVTSDETHVQSTFIESFLHARKTLAFLSGHAHAYEHFERGGKTFIVSGGGGGPRVELLTGDDARHDDLFEGPSPRPFHYLRLEPGPDEVEVRVRGFASGQLGIDEVDSFTLAYR
jgi:Icc-related predicted phosphoesterase